MTVTLERCRSHERHSVPQAWESVKTGTPAVIADYYSDELTHTQRVTDAWRVTDDTGRTWDMVEFLRSVYA